MSTAQKILLLVIFTVIVGAIAFNLDNIAHHTAGQQNPAARKLLESKESLYNNIYVYGEGDLRSMTFGYNRRIFTESVYNTKDELDLPVDYTQLMTAGLIYVKNIQSVLEIGLAVAVLPGICTAFCPMQK